MCLGFHPPNAKWVFLCQGKMITLAQQALYWNQTLRTGCCETATVSISFLPSWRASQGHRLCSGHSRTAFGQERLGCFAGVFFRLVGCDFLVVFFFFSPLKKTEREKYCVLGKHYLLTAFPPSIIKLRTAFLMERTGIVLSASLPLSAQRNTSPSFSFTFHLLLHPNRGQRAVNREAWLTDLSKTVGIKSYPIPSTSYIVLSVLFSSSGSARMEPSGSTPII